MSVLHYQPNLDAGTSAMRQPQGPPPLADEDLLWVGEYPELELRPAQFGRPARRGLLRRTYAGVIYGLAPAEFIGPLTRLGWSAITAGGKDFPPLKIVGNANDEENTTCDSVLLLGHGEPILGTEGNGRRRFLIHLEIEKRTGLRINPSQRMQNGKVTPEMVAAVRTK